MGPRKQSKYISRKNLEKKQFETINGKLDLKKPIFIESTKPNLEVRLGGIYALERIAQDSLRDHISVMEILSAYVRLNSPLPTAMAIRYGKNKAGRNYGNTDLKNDISAMPPTRIDIQAILSVIGRRKMSQIAFESSFKATPNSKEKFRIDLSDSNLQKADFENGNFTNVNFSRSALTGAQFWDANLSGSWLMLTRCENARFNYADLSKTELFSANLYHANCAHTNFKTANFIDVDTRNMSVGGADFSSATNLEPDQLDKMQGNEATILPSSKHSPIWAKPIHEQLNIKPTKRSAKKK